MNLEQAVGLAKNYAEKYTRSFVDFFGDGKLALAEGESPYQHIVAGAVIYLVLGVTLQDSFIVGLPIAEISWLDRALVQLVFWITIALILHLLIRLFTKARAGAVLAAFRVLPIAYLAGAYASALGIFAAFGLGLLNVTIPLPHVFHIIVQLALIALYLPRELRTYAAQRRVASRCLTALIFVVVLLVDLVVVFQRFFVTPTAG